MRRCSVAVLALILGVAGCGTPRLMSRWLDRKVAIDGDPTEWDGTLYTLEDSKVKVGFFNDGSDLYLCVGSEDRGVRRQVLGMGMTVWFDPGGGKNKVLGIRFPLGRAGGRTPFAGLGPDSHSLGSRPRIEPDSTGAGQPPGGELAGSGIRPSDLDPMGAGGRHMDMDPADAVAALRDSSAELEILHGEGPGTRMRVSEMKGAELKIGMKNEALVYELRIPLRSDGDHPFALDLAPGKTLGIGVETPKIDRSRFTRPNDGDRPPGGEGRPDGFPQDGGGMGRGGHRGGGWPGGGYGGHRGGMGPGGEGSRSGMFESLNLWMKVELARAAGTAKN